MHDCSVHGVLRDALVVAPRALARSSCRGAVGRHDVDSGDRHIASVRANETNERVHPMTRHTSVADLQATTATEFVLFELADVAAAVAQKEHAETLQRQC